MERRKYVSPEIEVHKVLVESLLAADSEDGKADSGRARRNNHFSFSSWDDEEEESSFPRSKSVWDD